MATFPCFKTFYVADPSSDEDELSSEADFFADVPQSVSVLALKNPMSKRTATGVSKPSITREDRGSNNNVVISRSDWEDVKSELADLRREVKAQKSGKELSPKDDREPREEFRDPDVEDKKNWVIGDGFEDDGCKRLGGMSLRCRLRPPNCDPASWPWGSPSFPDKISEPRRAASLYLEHLQGELHMFAVNCELTLPYVSGSKSPHPLTVYKAHARTEAMKVKKLLSKNGQPGQEPDYVFSFAGATPSNAKVFKSERDWRTPDSTFEVRHLSWAL